MNKYHTLTWKKKKSTKRTESAICWSVYSRIQRKKKNFYLEIQGQDLEVRYIYFYQIEEFIYGQTFLPTLYVRFTIKISTLRRIAIPFDWIRILKRAEHVEIVQGKWKIRNRE